jgi:hypothetical protein
MNTAAPQQVIPRRRILLCGLAALAILAQPPPASAQNDNMRTRLPAFQAPASDSLETQMMSRLSLGQLQPGDLDRLARLTVLRSISMLVNVRTDAPNSIIGSQLDQQITSLWDSSEAFYEVVSFSPLDPVSWEQAQYWLGMMDTMTVQIQGSLGELPGLSRRAADDLQSLSRLRGNIESLMGLVESNLVDQAPAPLEPSLDFDALRQDSQQVANDLVALIAKAGDTGRGRPGRDALVTELTDLLDRLQSFSKLLSTGPTRKATEDSFRLARRQMWRVEGRIVRLDFRASLENPWRGVRNQINAISNALGLPRIVELAAPPRTLTGQERTIAAHVDHAVAWLDEFFYDNRVSLRKTESGSQFLADVTGLRRELLALRRRALAGEPPPRLTELVTAIDRTSRQLSDRAAALARDGTNSSLESRYRSSAEAVRKLKGALAKG